MEDELVEGGSREREGRDFVAIGAIFFCLACCSGNLP